MTNSEKIKKLKIDESILVYEIDGLFFYAKRINDNNVIISLTDNIDTDKDEQGKINIDNLDEISNGYDEKSYYPIH